MITIVSACQNHIVICEIFICSLSFCPSPLPCLENVPSSLFAFISTYKNTTLCCTASPPSTLLFFRLSWLLPTAFFFFATPLFLVLCCRISQSSQSQSRDYAKPWLAHSKTPTPSKCQSCPEHSQTPGHEVTHCPLPVP